MKKRTIVNCCLAGLLLAGLGLTGVQDGATTLIDASNSTAAVRVGVFDSRGLALAYGRSARPDCMMAKVEQLRTEHDKAKAQGDEERMKQLEAEAVAMQDVIHKQVFSGAPIPEILAMIKGDLPGIAEKANVSLIVGGEVLFKGDDVELVDLTEPMSAPFEPDEATLRALRQLIEQPVVPESELSKEH